MAAPQPTSGTRDSPLFSEFCRLLESISARKGTDLKKQRLERYIQEWRTRYGDFFEAMRLLLPHLDKERAAYGMKEHALARTYVEVLGLGKESEDANHLIQWRMPGKNKQKTAGDFASVAYEVIAPRSTVVRGKMTVHDVNQQLDLLCTSNSRDYKDIIRHFVTNYTPDEQKWIIRIILKELKVGMSENSVFNVFHPDAFNLFNVCSSLRKVCADLKDPFVRLATNDIAIFHPIKPQLAHKELPQDIPKAMGSNKFYIQQKLDGERLQLHTRDGQFRYWSRKTTDYTNLYGANMGEGTLTPHIYNCFHHKARSLILDGEMVAWDPIGEQYLPFGTLKSAALDQTDDKDKIRPCFVVFDVIYCNGVPIIEQPLRERIGILPKIVQEKKGYLEILTHTEGSSVQDVVDGLDKAVAARQEGIVIKNPSCTYAPGQRNKDWIKVKPEYVDSLSDDVDVLIIGGIYGTGRRGDRLSHFMCAIRDDNVLPGSEPRFLTFCKIGTGYSMAQLIKFNEILKDCEPYNAQKQPSWLGHPERSTEKPDVIIRPEKSIIVQVKASEIIPSNQYATGYTLRFPRYVKTRDDKEWDDCMTATELIDLRRMAAGRLTNRKMTEKDLSTIKKRKSGGPRKTITYSFMPSQLGADSSKVQKVSELFDNMNFAVIVGDDKHTKTELEVMIKSHGGNYYQDESAVENIHIIAGQMKIRVRGLINRGTHDIIKPQWVFDCVENQDVIPLQPKYMLFTTYSTKEIFRKTIDRWGDSYTDEFTDAGLREVLAQMDPKPLDPPEKRRRLGDEILSKYFEHEGLPGNLFRRVVAYLDYSPSESKDTAAAEPKIDMAWALRKACEDRLDQVALLLRFHGAQIVNDPAMEGVTHVVMDSKDLSRLATLRELYQSRPQLPHIVSTFWVLDSSEESVILEERMYEPRSGSFTA